MKLLNISETTLINPSKIGCIEQDKDGLYMWIDGRKYEYDYEDKVSIKDFLEQVKQNLTDSQQYFAG